MRKTNGDELADRSDGDSDGCGEHANDDEDAMKVVMTQQ